MPGKRKEKENEGTKPPKKELYLNDQEYFLQAFEKPTQIYRYLRTRNMISPIFLNRTLSYMNRRMSRNHSKRASFKIDNMLEQKMNKLEEGNKHLGNYLSIIFDSFINKNRTINSSEYAKVETILFKIAYNKRKDTSSEIEVEYIGTSFVDINPSTLHNKFSVINIPSSSFKSDKGMLTNRSFIIVFRVHTYNENEPFNESISQQQLIETKTFGSELALFDRFGKCLLTEGEYIITLNEITQHIKPKAPTANSLKWETISDSILEECQNTYNPFEAFDKMLSLKFHLFWSKDALPSTIDSLSTISTINYASTFNQSIDSNYNLSWRKNQRYEKEEKAYLFFQFIYNNNSRQQTEASLEYYCPWCSLNCFELYPLLKHLKLCHERFSFIYVPQKNNTVYINVTINENFDGSYTGSPYDLMGQSGYVISRTGPIRRTVVTHLLVFRPRRQKYSLSEFLRVDETEINNQRPLLIGHNRLYHHTLTHLPIHPKELEIDSEAENDPSWLKRKTSMMIDEFTDVNSGEKELMKMWNLHVMKYVFVGDCQISIACDMFLEKNGREILKKNLYRNFLLHMCSLFDHGLIASEFFLKIVQKLQKLLSEHPDAKKILTESRAEHNSHWITIGMFKPPMLGEPRNGLHKRCRIN